jgi:hypothetical protein
MESQSVDGARPALPIAEIITTSMPKPAATHCASFIAPRLIPRRICSEDGARMGTIPAIRLSRSSGCGRTGWYVVGNRRLKYLFPLAVVKFLSSNSPTGHQPVPS